MILLSIAHGLSPEIPRTLAGIAAWIAGLLLLNRLRGQQRIQTLLMFLFGIAGMGYSLWHTGSADIERAVASNQALLAMLAGVSFLRLITLPTADSEERRPRGPHALWSTLFGVHLFGAVINLSSVMILGDRQSTGSKLTGLQATVLSRGFAMAAHWSPFFAAMGIALTNAPGSQLLSLMAVGIPVTLVALAVTGWQLTRKPETATFIGYPMHFEALLIPGVLAVLVLVIHALRESTPILTLIASLSLLITLLRLWLGTGIQGIKKFQQHITDNLPGMSGELLLFLAAGVLAAGISSTLTASGFTLPFKAFGTQEAILLLYGMVALSLIGIHPVISISAASSLLMPIVTDPNLLAITFLMTWALGVSISPFSGMHLGMQGRFGLNSWKFVRWNGSFTLFMLAVDSLVLTLYPRFS